MIWKRLYCKELVDVTVIDKVHTCICTNRTSSLQGRTRGVFVLKQQCEEAVLTTCRFSIVICILFANSYYMYM